MLTVEDDHELILERAREYEATVEDERVTAKTLAELRAPGEMYSRQCQTI